MTGWKKKNKYRNLKVGSTNEVSLVFKYYKKSYVTMVTLVVKMINFSSKSRESLRLKLFVKCHSKIENCAGKMQILCVSRSKLCCFFTKVRSGVKVQSKSSEPILIPFRFLSDCGAEDSQRSPGSMAWQRPNPYLTGGGVKEGPILTHPRRLRSEESMADSLITAQ